MMDNKSSANGLTKSQTKKIALFGLFGRTNLGNDSTLETIVHHISLWIPGAEISCICRDPSAVESKYCIKGISSRPDVIRPWQIQNPIIKIIRRIVVSVPSEFYRWIEGIRTMRRMDALLIPGTGVLTDAWTLLDWGPYELFRWVLTAKLCGAKVFFVSVGAGPLFTNLGRWLVRNALLLADYRSYRDDPTRKFLEEIGVSAEVDTVSPDLVFSLPYIAVQKDSTHKQRQVVGLGVMEYAGKYASETPGSYDEYLKAVKEFAMWLLSCDYDVRILIGDLGDIATQKKLGDSLRKELMGENKERIIDDPAKSPRELLEQIESTDFVVATRFHNVLMSMLLNKPVLAISFHHKCSALMEQMGMSQYCLNINTVTAEELIGGFCSIRDQERNIRDALAKEVSVRHEALNKQYSYIINKL